jgi:hypothetical protein
VKFVPVESVSGEVLWGGDPQVRGQTEGAFEFQIFCLPIPSVGALYTYAMRQGPGVARPSSAISATGRRQATMTKSRPRLGRRPCASL